MDKVDHTKPLGRLHQYGITGKLHGWFRPYLRGRKQQVAVVGAASRELQVTSGVPQGSLLGPILFLLFVDDLPNAVKTSRVACYADDTLPCNLTLMILSIGLIHPCSYLISSSCKYQCITRKKSPVQPSYTINEIPLESCDTEKYLGVWVSSNLTSDKQVTEPSSLCAELLGTSNKAPKRVVHCTFLSSGAISATQPKYGRHSPLVYLNQLKMCSAVQQN